MTESQMVSLVLRYRDIAGETPSELRANPHTILKLVREHSLTDVDIVGIRPVVRVLGVPIVADRTAPLGCVYIMPVNTKHAAQSAGASGCDPEEVGSNPTGLTAIPCS